MAEARRPVQPDMVAGLREKLGMVGRNLAVVGRMDDQRRHGRFGKLARADEFVERTSGDALHLIGHGRLRARAEIEIAAEILEKPRHRARRGDQHQLRGGERRNAWRSNRRPR